MHSCSDCAYSQPCPLQEFMPEQLFLAVLHALFDLQLLMPAHLTLLAAGAGVPLSAASALAEANIAAAANAATIPVRFKLLIEFSIYKKLIGLLALSADKDSNIFFMIFTEIIPVGLLFSVKQTLISAKKRSGHIKIKNTGIISCYNWT